MLTWAIMQYYPAISNKEPRAVVKIQTNTACFKKLNIVLLNKVRNVKVSDAETSSAQAPLRCHFMLCGYVPLYADTSTVGEMCS